MTHLSEIEKQQIISLYNTGASYRAISRQLHRNISTISRFLKSHNHKDGFTDHALITNTIQLRIQQYTNIFNLLLKKDVGMSHINNYTALFSSYLKTDIKPDKQYSMLYSILQFLDIEKNNTIADIGCGTGYFTHAIAKCCHKVIGIDNNYKQLEGAKTIGIHLNSMNIEYVLSDMWEYVYTPNSFDRICAPFVINYSKSVKELERLFKNFYEGLKQNGKLVGLIDNPHDIVHNNKEYGSIKTIPSGKLIDGALIELQLFNNNHLLCTLYSCYYAQKTIESALYKIGFTKVERKKPLISPEGINEFPSEYWINYMGNCDIAYFIAIK